MKILRQICFWFGRRSIIIVSFLLIAVGALLVWYISTGFSSNDTGVVIGVASISAFLAAISAIANLLAAVEVQRQRENNERPYVQGYFDTGNSGVIYFIIQNFGNSPALDVTIKFIIAPVDFANRPLGEVSLFSKPISFIAPGQKFRQLVNVGFKLLADGNPTKFEYMIAYSSSNYQKFVEKVETDLSYLKQATVPGKSIEEQLGTIHQDLEKLVRYFERVDGMGSILVETPDENSDRINRMVVEEVDLPKWKRYFIVILKRLIKALGK